MGRRLALSRFGVAEDTPHPYPVSKVSSFNGLERGVALRSSWGRASPQNPLGKGVRGDLELAKTLDPAIVYLRAPLPKGEGVCPTDMVQQAGEIIGKTALEVLRLYCGGWKRICAKELDVA